MFTQHPAPRSILLLAVFLTACGTGQEEQNLAEEAETPMPEIVIGAGDFSYEVPAQIPAGPLRIRMENGGMELHHVTLVRIPDGGSVEALLAGLTDAGGPEGYEFFGGPNAAPPQGASSAEVDLRPGSYAVVCLIPSPDQELHFRKGMVATFEAVASESQAVVEASDLTLRLTDYAFAWDTPPTSGQQRVRIENTGAEIHEAVLARMAPGKTPEDLLNWVVNPEGPPPAEPLGGASFLDPGASNVTEVDFTPGHYALFCFVLGPDGVPHFAHGMLQEFEIEA